MPRTEVACWEPVTRCGARGLRRPGRLTRYSAQAPSPASRSKLKRDWSQRWIGGAAPGRLLRHVRAPLCLTVGLLLASGCGSGARPAGTTTTAKHHVQRHRGESIVATAV